MRFTEHEMVFFNSITKGNDVFGIPLKFRPQKGHEEEVKKTINGLIEKGVLASETELTKMGFLPARALECYKESRNHVIINYLHIALLEQREAIVIIQSSPNLCVNSSFSYVVLSTLLLSSRDLTEWSLVYHNTLSYQRFYDLHSIHYDHLEGLHQLI